MKVSLNWLKQYVDIDISPAKLADKLTMAGNEVKGVEVIGGTWESIVVGQITAVNPHPNADRLTLVTIDFGTGQETVVCGAPNVRAGAKVAFAPVGAQLIDPRSGETFSLKSAKIRGIVSSGMACSEAELGISDSHEGILILPDEAPVGIPLADYMGDAIFNMDITPNRVDCLSMIGIAREIAVLTGQTVHLPEVSYEEADPPVERQITVEIADPDLCPRYCASLITGIKVGESPSWMQERLISYGMRPINNIVDVTNFVMLEYGQPLHAFDHERIRGRKIIVRRAIDGEVLVSLDGEERNLSGDMLVIADQERAVALAGVMGGANSEVTEQTTSILLEAANFSPTSIHYTGRVLRMPSEACMRFERGIGAEVVMPALKRATQLIAELGGGRAARGVVDVYPGRKEPEPVLLSTSEVKRVLGVEFSLEQIMNALTSLGFDCRPGNSGSEVWATAPYWRSDIGLPVDLIEEVARIIGYDEIPTTMLSQPIPTHSPEPVVELNRELSRRLTGYGFQEIISYSTTGLEMLSKLRPETHSPELLPLRVLNPMTVEQEYLRPNLRASLLNTLSANIVHASGGIRIFELARVYLPRPNDLPDEPEVLCGLLNGPRQEKSWQGGGDELVDFFDAKGIVESLLGQFGVTADFIESQDESLHPVKQAVIVADGSKLGVVGELHPRVLEAFEISEPVYLFEIRLSELLPYTTSYKVFQPIARFPAMVRDMALVIDAGVTYRKVVDIIKGFPLVERVAVFDVYSGEQVPAGKKSLACRVTYQSPAHTLTDEEVNKVQQKILRRLSHDLGAVLRG
jgi:phenylalanyl-tRNA synthetase beta chain